MNAVAQAGNDVLIKVRVIPRASQTRLAGELGGALKIRLQAPPVDGKANSALVKWLAGTLGIQRRRIAIQAGEKTRNKLIMLKGIDAATVIERLELTA